MPSKNRSAKQTAPENKLTREGTATGEVLTAVSTTIRTLDDALVAGNVDLDLWEVERYVINKWDMAAKTRSYEAGHKDRQSELTVTELWQVKVWLKRKISKHITDAAEALIERMKEHAPIYPQYEGVTLEEIDDPHMLELSMPDIHVGKLAWSAETGSNYDLKIAIQDVKLAARKLLNSAHGYNIEKILIPVGNDYYQMNNAQGTTAKGTPVDCDGRMAKIFDAGCMLMVEIIDMCMEIAPVEVIWVPGNHDPDTSRFMARFLEAWYHNTKRVTVDATPPSRKAILYGPTLIGFTHGDKEPHRDLPAIMAGQWPDLWAKAKFRHWHLGHLHKKKELHSKIGDTYAAGVEIRHLPSLSGTDAWHTEQGYSANRAAEAYLYSATRGPVGYFTVNAITELQ